MAEKILPFNITLLQMTDQMVQGIKPVTVMDIFDNTTKNFHAEGLFSTEIFGKVGTQDRMKRFSYIQLATPILHPIIYKTIIELKSYYEEIMSGKLYAEYDPVAKEFIKSTPTEGKTGYLFFMNHWQDLRFLHNKSTRRDLKIDLLDKFKDRALTDRIVVIPAGYRDFIIEQDGKPTEDEINGIYRKFISKNSLLPKTVLNKSGENLDGIVYSLQDTFNDLYNYIKDMLSGKNKLVTGKWAARRTFNSTRNVASAPILDVPDLNHENYVKMDDSQVGLYQYTKAISPIAIHLLRDRFLDNIVQEGNNVYLIDPKTLHRNLYPLKGQTIDRWTTDEGIEKVLNNFSISDSRFLPVEIEDKYLKLVYDTGDMIRLLDDISELPEGADEKKVRPLTYAEMWCICVANDSLTRPGFFTRYPITGYGSIYPSRIYLKTTVKGRTVAFYKDSASDPEVIREYPILYTDFFDTISVSPIHMGRLGLDFDGDTMSFTAMFSDQSVNEITKLLNSAKYYKDFRGDMAFGAAYDTVNLVIKNMTADPEE